MAFLRLAENPRDFMAGTRVLMLLPGIGPKRASNLMDRLGATAPGAPSGDESRAFSPDALSTLDGDDDADLGGLARPPATAGHFAAWANIPPPTPAAQVWNDLVALMESVTGPDPGDLASQIHRIRQIYAPLLERLYDNARARLMDLEQLEWLAARFPDRSRFLTELALDPPNYTEDLAGPPLLDEDFLILSTMHSAKGLEWDAVYLIHAVDGNIPSDMATGNAEEIEEERRLFYVALTRAKDWLYVCFPMRYYSYPRTFSDAHGYALLTRFVSSDVQAFFEQIPASDLVAPAGSVPEEHAEGGREGAVTTEDIRRRLKDFF